MGMGIFFWSSTLIAYFVEHVTNIRFEIIGSNFAIHGRIKKWGAIYSLFPRPLEDIYLPRAIRCPARTPLFHSLYVIVEVDEFVNKFAPSGFPLYLFTRRHLLFCEYSQRVHNEQRGFSPDVQFGPARLLIEVGSVFVANESEATVRQFRRKRRDVCTLKRTLYNGYGAENIGASDSARLYQTAE